MLLLNRLGLFQAGPCCVGGQGWRLQIPVCIYVPAMNGCCTYRHTLASVVGTDKAVVGLGLGFGRLVGVIQLDPSIKSAITP